MTDPSDQSDESDETGEAGEAGEADTVARHPSRRASAWRRALRWAILGGVVSWTVMSWSLDRYGRERPPPQGRWDAIVVLGCRVYPDGQPSKALARRVDMAVELYTAGRAATIVLTGGKGDSGPVEAEVAAARAESLGVPRAAMVLETQSTSTEQNAELAAEAIAGRRVVVVTDAYHVLRSERVFARYFDEVAVVGTVSPNWGARVRGALREVVALAGYAAQGRL